MGPLLASPVRILLCGGLVLGLGMDRLPAAGPPVFLRHPQPLAVPSGHTTVLTAETAFEPTLRWEWRKNGAVVPGAVSGRLTLFHAMDSDTAEYHAVALTDGGLRWSDPAAVIVLPPAAGPGRVDPAFTDPGMDGPVSALTTAGNGAVIAAGEFSSARGLTNISRIVRIRPDGLPDPAYRAGMPGPDGPVEALATAGSAVYAAGSFAGFDGSPAPGLVRLGPDGLRDAAFQPDLPPVVEEVRVIVPLPDGRLYAGGRSRPGGVASDWLVRLAADGTRDPTFIPPPFLNGRLRAVALCPDGRLWLAGNFFRPAGSTTHFNRLALITATGTVDPAFKPPAGASSGANLEVRCLQALPDGSCVIGGFFNRFNNIIRYGMARVRGDGSLEASFNPPVLDDVVSALALDSQDRLYAGGGFSLIGTLPVRSVARLDALTGNPDNTWKPPMSNGPVQALLAGPAGLTAGGSFSLPHQAVVRLLLEASVPGPPVTSAALPLSYPAKLFQRPQTLASAPGNGSVPDEGTAGFPIPVSSAAPMDEVRLWLDLRHPDVQALKLELVPPFPGATPLVLTEGSTLRHGADYFRTCFTMQSPRALSLGGAPYTDALRPETDFTTLHGFPANGTWMLRITDRRLDSRQAVLLSATLEIFHAAAAPGFPAWLGNRPAGPGDFTSFAFAETPGRGPVVSLLAHPLQLSHRAWSSDDETAFTYWTSTDLMQWQSVTPLSCYTAHTPQGSTLAVTLPPSPAPRRWWRVQANRVP